MEELLSVADIDMKTAGLCSPEDTETASECFHSEL